VKEPARTERNLAHPCTIWKANGADLLEAYQFPFCPLASGTSRVSVYFNHFIMTMQLTMGILAGLGKAGILVGAAARAQVQAINGIQFAIFLYVWLLFPAHDRVDNLMFACQFALEGTMTALLANQGDGDFVETAKASAFGLSLLALAVPLLRRFYDGVIVQCIKLRRKGPFNKKAAALAFTIFLLQLQGMVLKLIGIQSSEAGMTSAVTANTAKLANREATAGAMGAAAIVDVGSMLAADAYAVIFGADGPTQKHTDAATVIQKMMHARLANSHTVKRRRAVVLKQAIARAMLAKKLRRRLLAARTVQAHERGRAARRHVAAYRAVKVAAWAAQDERYWSRPGFAWLLRQEQLIVAHERIECIRQSRPLAASHMSFPRLLGRSGGAARRVKVGPGASIPKVKRAPPSLPSDEQMTESSESDDFASLGDVEARICDSGELKSAFHRAAGVVFTQNEICNGQVGESAWERKRRIARSVLPATEPPIDLVDDTTWQQRLCDNALDYAEILWEDWLKPALILFAAYTLLGPQTFPPRPKRTVGMRRVRSQKLKLLKEKKEAEEAKKKKQAKDAQIKDGDDEEVDGDGDGGD